MYLYIGIRIWHDFVCIIIRKNVLTVETLDCFLAVRPPI